MVSFLFSFFLGEVDSLFSPFDELSRLETDALMDGVSYDDIVSHKSL